MDLNNVIYQKGTVTEESLFNDESRPLVLDAFLQYYLEHHTSEVIYCIEKLKQGFFLTFMLRPTKPAGYGARKWMLISMELMDHLKTLGFDDWVKVVRYGPDSKDPYRTRITITAESEEELDLILGSVLTVSDPKYKRNLSIIAPILKLNTLAADKISQ